MLATPYLFTKVDCNLAINELTYLMASLKVLEMYRAKRERQIAAGISIPLVDPVSILFVLFLLIPTPGSRSKK